MGSSLTSTRCKLFLHQCPVGAPDPIHRIAGFWKDPPLADKDATPCEVVLGLAFVLGAWLSFPSGFRVRESRSG